MAAEPSGIRRENDAMLPMAKRSKLAQRTEAYCRFGSWTICETCHALRPKPFKAMDVQRDPPAEISGTACCFCSPSKKRPTSKGTVEEGRRHLVPQPDDVPEPLRDLAPEIIEALRPLDIDVGDPMRAPSGWVQHRTMIRFAWSADSVEDKIKALKHKAVLGLIPTHHHNPQI